jgi:hypothetical protein
MDLEAIVKVLKDVIKQELNAVKDELKEEIKDEKEQLKEQTLSLPVFLIMWLRRTEFGG